MICILLSWSFLWHSWIAMWALRSGTHIIRYIQLSFFSPNVHLSMYLLQTVFLKSYWTHQEKQKRFKSTTFKMMFHSYRGKGACWIAFWTFSVFLMTSQDIFLRNLPYSCLWYLNALNELRFYSNTQKYTFMLALYFNISHFNHDLKD